MRWLLALLFVALGPLAHAQDSSPLYEFGFHLGNLLPNQIRGVTEIMGLGGVRVAGRMAPGSYLEFGGMTGNGEGQQWKNVNVSYRVDMAIEDLIAFMLFGADTVYYRGQTGGNKLIFGGHVGGGLQAQISSSTWFRGDMKFSMSPGTSLYIGFGFVWRFGS